jgi:hypothetical protein
MKRLGLTATALACTIVIGSGSAGAELKLPRVSPNASVKQTIGYTDVAVTYSRPGVKGRTIWGALVPWDKPWRTGANEATSFVTSGDVKINGQRLPAGTYSFFTIPSQGEWTVVFNKEKDLWGAFEYKPEQDALRIKATPRAAEPTEWLSFGFENLTPATGELVMRWEKIALPITIETDAVNEMLTQARTEIAAAKPDDWRTAFRSADYCFKNGLNADEARQWAEKSVKVQETYLNVSLLAQMRAKDGNIKDAVTLAQKAVKLGKESKDKVDTSPTEALLAEWTAKK